LLADQLLQFTDIVLHRPGTAYINANRILAG